MDSPRRLTNKIAVLSKLSAYATPGTLWRFGLRMRCPIRGFTSSSSNASEINKNVSAPRSADTAWTTELELQRGTGDKIIPMYRILDPRGTVITGRKPDVANDEILKMYASMVFVTIMDQIMFNAQRQGKISFYLLSTGEEAISVGSASALSPCDVVFAQYRETGLFRYRGFTADNFMNQLFATANDPGRGRNMPVQYGSRELNCHTISAPLATQIPQAAGAAYALKLRASRDPTVEKGVAACFFGDGAASEGDFHAGLNIAATRACPVLFICRNNGYAISTPTQEQHRGDGIASRGPAYGIDTLRVDGNDALAMHVAIRHARQLAWNGGKPQPVLIEAMSYRMAHHSTSDDSLAYRGKDEVERSRANNPITRLRVFMEQSGIWDAEKEKDLHAACRKEILTAYRNAEKSRHPPLRSMMEDVYSEMTEEQEEQWQKMVRVMSDYPHEYDLSMFQDA